MKSGSIKSFSIYELFGTSDFHIPFDEDIKILVGENGLGKTQALNIFYYTLTRNYFRLSEFNFQKINLSFSSGDIEITKSQVEDLTKEIYGNPIIKQFVAEFGHAHFEIIRNKYIYTGKNGRKKLEVELDSNPKFRKYPYHRILRIIEELDRETKDLFNPLAHCDEKILDGISGNEILYFPTYRRVEEDLHILGYDEDELQLNEENTLIQFGMEDVKKRFGRIENAIDRFLKEGLAQFTKDILSVVIDEFEPSDNILQRINEDDIDIILSRVGVLLPQKQKEAVKSIVANKQYKNPLSAYLLQKLTDIYEKQKELDNSVKVFRDVCNRYLINKKVFYDESAIKIYIKSESTNAEIALSNLSSGEKQIISIFSKIYLSERGKRFIVLFDEPELSLSILWQRQLLPDIVNSTKCDFLLAVTHSPFIYENELDKYAIGLDEYIKPSKTIMV
jgi:predicted ATP-dependent endonuclease of OLD family